MKVLIIVSNVVVFIKLFLTCSRIKKSHPVFNVDRLSYRRSYKSPRGLTSMHVNNFTCDAGVTNLGQCTADFDVTSCSDVMSDAVWVLCSGNIIRRLTHQLILTHR